ncbi:hypothetical protein HPB50_028495 [Hyalomma asiaticum]|nr:hypothetical protein HPB50_028495 [Hyalomma asiaticum]
MPPDTMGAHVPLQFWGEEFLALHQPDDNAMAVFVNTDGFPTKIFPFVDELGITVMDRDAELYNTAALSFVFANGTKARVMCASGSLGTVDASTVYPARSLHKQPSEVPEQATQRAPEDALWRTGMTRFPRDKYKEHFGNIGKKGGLSEAALPVDDEPEFGSLELPGSFADYVGADDDVAVCSEVSLDDIIETGVHFLQAGRDDLPAAAQRAEFVHGGSRE